MQVGAAMSVLSEMGRLGVPPNAETYHHVIKILVQSRSDKSTCLESLRACAESECVAFPSWESQCRLSKA